MLCERDAATLGLMLQVSPGRFQHPATVLPGPANVFQKPRFLAQDLDGDQDVDFAIPESLLLGVRLLFGSQ